MATPSDCTRSRDVQISDSDEENSCFKAELVKSLLLCVLNIEKEIKFFIVFINLSYTWKYGPMPPTVSTLLSAFVVKSNSWILISNYSISLKLSLLFSLVWMIWMVKIRPWCLKFLTSICTCAGAALLWSEQLVPCCCLKPCPESRSNTAHWGYAAGRGCLVFSQGWVVIGQGEMALNWERAGADWILKSFLT